MIVQDSSSRTLSSQDIEAAWSILCPNGRSLCRAEAEALLQSFYSGKLGPKQLRSLVPPGGISCEWLAQLLVEMPLAQGVDVCSQAFSVLDPAKNGAADMATLKQFMKQLHNIELSEGELLMLQQVADTDMDGAISLEDFRVLFSRQQAAPLAAPAPACSLQPSAPAADSS
uniref:EF-hand domain-containing protein n=1 Tax=Tetradesmus obliquus TaxID=3088 RepID=A0A383WHI3_TETOB|eukprot:jgi/Sobl393_1/14770/SZX62508.1